MPNADAAAVSGALASMLGDAALRERLGAAGAVTAAEFSWDRRIDALEQFLLDVARPRRIAVSTQVVPASRIPSR